ncbi:hypothetical protein C8J36_11464 [Rhizobium sp. PP-F2F-G48]|uniref:hypothetical protein n=1 Tax=Rhizobium sp. PP-F2F-G48 TaxID=2135651 RepID=UPI0010D149C7|nr:hypothetical protein [Rhizobium sp. PP-F2F-G48]TCM48364.1 hypothetical protein C8J36_11464 [Rhizobium sp. PP-F2F-G48]
MDLVAVEGDEKASSHSADDSHQHYAKGEGIDDRPAPRRVEVSFGDFGGSGRMAMFSGTVRLLDIYQPA